MKQFRFLGIFMILSVFYACGTSEKKVADAEKPDTFKYQTEQFGDHRILRYNVQGFDSLSLKQKEMLYYLYNAALCGRDLIWDQNYKYNLLIRKTCEAIINNYKGDRNSNDFKNFITYFKTICMSNGIHHHASGDKTIPQFSKEYFAELLKNTPEKELIVEKGKKVEDLINFLTPILFDPKIDGKKINLDASQDIIKTSACNFYDGVYQKEVEAFYSKMVKPNDTTPISYGLNSKVVKEKGKIVEKAWKVGGLYTQAIEKIVYWLEKALPLSENQEQQASLAKLIEFYKTGDLKTFDEYCILWVKDTQSLIDVVNGFIEVYGDPLGKKGSFQSMVSVRNIEATKRAKAISDNAKWFEDNSPIADEYKRKEVKGVTAKVIDVVVESGDNSPMTPIGVNLPNSDWIRKDYGSKSVTLENITYSYDESGKSNGSLEEFSYSQQDIDLSKKYGALAGNVHTDLHEILGHASGQLKPGVADASETLKQFASALEESRADLVALYYITDPKLVELGILPSVDAGKAEYASYIQNGLMRQLARIEYGKNIEQAHMRCRALISGWAYDKGKAENVIEKKQKDGKTYFVVNDFDKLRKLFGELLKEIQRIKSEGDFNAGKNLVETYAIKINPDLHKEVLDRWQKLNIAPYAGFINPKLVPVMEGEKITNVKIEYPLDFLQQMLEYGKDFSLLPVKN